MPEVNIIESDKETHYEMLVAISDWQSLKFTTSRVGGCWFFDGNPVNPASPLDQILDALWEKKSVAASRSHVEKATVQRIEEIP